MKTLKVFAAVLLFCFSAITHAGYYQCSGTIDRFEVTSNGLIQVTSDSIFGLNSNGKAICRLTDLWKNNVEADACSAWLKILIEAKSGNSEITVTYNDLLTCETQPDYSMSSPPHSVSLK